MRAWPPLRVIVGIALTIAGAGIAVYPHVTDVAYVRTQQAMRVQSLQAAPAGWMLPKGAVARLVIPRIALDAFVLEGTSAKVLDRAPGHYPETPLPGEPGNSAIAGHRTMYGHPFRRLDELKAGDTIVTYTSGAKATYRVVSLRPVKPTAVEVADPTLDDRLTLTTCNPVGSAAQRLVVVAALQR